MLVVIVCSVSSVTWEFSCLRIARHQRSNLICAAFIGMWCHSEDAEAIHDRKKRTYGQALHDYETGLKSTGPSSQSEGFWIPEFNSLVTTIVASILNVLNVHVEIGLVIEIVFKSVSGGARVQENRKVLMYSVSEHPCEEETEHSDTTNKNESDVRCVSMEPSDVDRSAMRCLLRSWIHRLQMSDLWRGPVHILDQISRIYGVTVVRYSPGNWYLKNRLIRAHGMACACGITYSGVTELPGHVKFCSKIIPSINYFSSFCISCLWMRIICLHEKSSSWNITSMLTTSTSSVFASPDKLLRNFHHIQCSSDIILFARTGPGLMFSVFDLWATFHCEVLWSLFIACCCYLPIVPMKAPLNVCVLCWTAFFSRPSHLDYRWYECKLNVGEQQKQDIAL